jgi:hypothetical protein
MRPHLRYLRYVLTHKLYVFIAGLAIGRVNGYRWSEWPGWVWRLLVHDLSKFRPSEWGPYVNQFYGDGPTDDEAPAYDLVRKHRRKARFDRAWLWHQHRNPHHWQHWILKEDSGKTILLLMDRFTADEMVADWLGAGTKILHNPSFAVCVAETVLWYVKQANVIQLREITRTHVEGTLVTLAEHAGVLGAAIEIHTAQQARDSIVIPGREPSRR